MRRLFSAWQASAAHPACRPRGQAGNTPRNQIASGRKRKWWVAGGRRSAALKSSEFRA